MSNSLKYAGYEVHFGVIFSFSGSEVLRQCADVFVLFLVLLVAADVEPLRLCVMMAIIITRYMKMSL